MEVFYHELSFQSAVLSVENGLLFPSQSPSQYFLLNGC